MPNHKRIYWSWYVLNLKPKKIDIEDYELGDITKEKKYTSIEDVPDEIKNMMEDVGIDISHEQNTDVYIQTNNSHDLCVSNLKDIELMPINEAIKKYDGKDGGLNLQDYLWKAVSKDKDEFTLETSKQEITQGYFIYAKKGSKSTFPLQSCLFIDLPGLKQVVHNIIIAEEGAQLDLVTGCTVHKTVEKALHIGVSEFYVKKDARVSFTMVHNWTDNTNVRPRTGIILEENASFSNFYVVMSEVKDLQTNPTIYLNGDNSSYYGQTLIYAEGASKFDTGATCYLRGKNTNAQVLSRVIAIDESYVKARGHIIGEGENVTGHIDCSALLLSKKARVDSVPRIDALNPNVRLTHEASVGKISADHIEYLMSRGLTEEEAIDLIIRGFLDADTSKLPPKLAAETKKMIKLAADSEMG